jgi:hypothetical protein
LAIFPRKDNPQLRSLSEIMPKLNQGLAGQFCSRMVSLHRRTKIAMMVTADLIALPFCFLVAMLLRGGDMKLASHFGPAFLCISCGGDDRSVFHLRSLSRGDSLY